MNDLLKDWLICGFFLSIGIFIGISIPLGKDMIDIAELQQTIETERCLEDSLDFDCIQKNLEKHRVRFSHIVMAQIKLESNNLKHRRVKDDKNIIGMRVAAQRFSFASNFHDYGAFAKYENIEDCILDIRAWQIQNAFFLTTDSQYLDLLSKVYCKDPGYIEQVKKLIR